MSKRILSIFLAFSLCLSGCQYLPAEMSVDAAAEKVGERAATAAPRESKTTKATDAPEEDVQEALAEAWDGVTNEEIYAGDGFEVTFTLQSVWDSGYTGNVNIKNTGSKTIDNWGLVFDFQGGFSNVWNAEYTQSGTTYTFRNAGYNQGIAAGESADFGFVGNSAFESFPTGVRLVVYSSDSDKEGTTVAEATDENGNSNSSGTDGSGDDNSGSNDSSNGSASSGSSGSSTSSSDGTSGTATSTSGGNQVAKHGRLKVKGMYIVDKNNKKYQLKGASTHGVAWFPQYVNTSCFKSFKKMGANTIRLACYSSAGEGYNTSTVWKTMDKGIKAATDLGMYVIVDWHILNNGNPKTDMKAAKKFFKRFAKKYGKRKNIIWEICNEPNGCNWSSDIKPYAKKIIKLIREYSSNIIVVGTPTWSQDVDVVADSPLTGSYKKNVCYTIHFYAATHGDNIRNKVKYAAKKKLPILCTEFSICDASGNGGLDKSSGKKWIKLLNKYKIGFIAWNISNKNESSSLIKPSVTKTGNFKKSNLSASGKWIVKQW